METKFPLPCLMNRCLLLTPAREEVALAEEPVVRRARQQSSKIDSISKELQQLTFSLPFEQISGQEYARCQMPIIMPLLRHWPCLMKPNFTQLLLAYQGRALQKSGPFLADQSQVIPLERFFVS